MQISVVSVVKINCVGYFKNTVHYFVYKMATITCNQSNYALIFSPTHSLIYKHFRRNHVSSCNFAIMASRTRDHGIENAAFGSEVHSMRRSWRMNSVFVYFLHVVFMKFYTKSFGRKQLSF